MFSFLFSRPKKVGLEITNDEIKLLQITCYKKNYYIEDFTCKALPKNTIVDGKIKQFEQVYDALHSAIVETNSKNLPTVLALPSPHVITKFISIDPAIKQKAYLEYIKLHLPQYFPGIKENLAIDYVTIPKQENGMKKTLIAAMRKEQVDSYKILLQEAKLKLQAIDMDMFALARCLYSIVKDPQETICFIDITYALTKFLVLHKGYLVFWQHWPTQENLVWEQNAKRALQYYVSTAASQINTVYLTESVAFFYQNILEKLDNCSIKIINPTEYIHTRIEMTNFQNNFSGYKVCYGAALSRKNIC